MRTLFSKIFLTFWLMILLTIVLTVIVLKATRTDPAQLPPFLSKSVVRAEMAFQRNGEKGLIRWLKRMNNQFPKRSVFITNEHGLDLLGRSIPLKIEAIANRVSQERKVVGQQSGKHTLFGYYLTAHGNTSYRIVFKVPPSPKQFFDHFINNIWLTLVAVLILSGIICYLLAKNITHPIRAIQKASNQLAEGDLDVNIIHDLLNTKFMNRKDELAELARDFDQMATQIKHAHNHQNRLIQDMSHELRAPISRMQVALTLLEDELSNSNPADLADSSNPLTERLHQELETLESIIKHTLSLPLFENTKHPLSDEQDLTNIINKLIQDVQFQSQTKLSINYENQCHSALMIKTKDNWLETAIGNLLSNAIQYRTPNTPINILCRQLDQTIEVSIQNDGQGVEPSALKDIFEPFYRSDQARTPGTTNLGLGLPMVKRIARLLGGTVEARNLYQTNEQISGFEVILRLPKSRNK